MLMISVLYFLIILLESYLLGKIIKKLFFKTNRIALGTPLGFFMLLGLFQLAVFPVVYFKLDAGILGYWLIILLMAIPIAAVVMRVRLLPSKSEWAAIVIGLGICLLFGYSASRQTLGAESFDTVFYLSTTLHNSTANVLGDYFGYSGLEIPQVSMLYDYQGIYHFYAQFLKFTKFMFSYTYELTPVYIWTASLTYFYILSSTLLNCIHLLLKKNGIFVKSCAFLFCLVLFSSYYNTTFAFYGNTMKTLAVTNLICILYCWMVKKDCSIFLMFSSFCSLIACSSSGLFQGIFIYIGLMFAAGTIPLRKSKDYFWLGLACIPLFTYGIILINADVLLVLPALVKKVLPIVYLIFLAILFCLRFLSASVIKKLFLSALAILTCGLFLLSFLIRSQVDGGFGYFFTQFSTFDMTLNYFSFTTPVEILRNLTIYILLLGGLIFAGKKSRLRMFILSILLIFMNPLTAPAIFKFLTNVVYGRCFEVIINPMILAWCWSMIINKGLKNLPEIVLSVFQGGLGIIGVSLCMISLFTPYNKLFNPDDDFDAVARVNKDQMDLYKAISDIVDTLPEKPAVLSQDYELKAYVENLYLTLSVTDLFSAEVYDDERGEAPSELLNIFYPRDYPGQKAWDNEPDYSRACPAIEANNVDYIVMSKDVQIDRGDGIIEPLWLHIRSCAKELYSNDSYVFLKKVNWAEENR